MPFSKSLRAKVLVSAVIPITLALVVVAIIALFAYEREAGKVVRQRDAELANVSAARLAEGLSRLNLLLQTIANDDDVQSLEAARMKRALEREQNQLFVFNAGVVIYDGKGVAVWSDPFAFQRRGLRFPVRSEFDKVLSTLMPSFSNVFRDEISGEDVVLLTVPIVAKGPEFKGAVAGMSTLNSLLLNATYSEVLEITAGSERFAYLVDGNGQVIFHSDLSRLGTDLSTIVPVNRVTEGETGAIIAEGPEGETVISGFAPVPDTDWAVITQEKWESVVGPIRGFSRVLLGLLVMGGVLSAALIFIAIGRILRPIKELTRGAQRIAGGDFEHTISAKASDEIQVLAQQFNTMAGALKESYAGLEKKVAERTKELRESQELLSTVVTGAPIVLFAVNKEGEFTLSEGTGLDALGLIPGEIVGQSVYDVYGDVPQIVEDIRRALAGEEITSTVPVGEFTFESRYSPVRGDSGEVIGLIGVATDVTEGKQAEATIRESEERYRTLFEDTRDAIFISSVEGTIIDCNQAALELFGFTEDEALGSDIGERYVDSADRERFREEISRTGSVRDFEVKLRKKDRTEMYCLLTASRRRTEDGSNLGVQGTVRDITEHKQAEETQRELVVLEERNRMAREIHDTLAQGFTGIVLQLEAAEQGLEGSPAEVPDHLSKAKNLARESLQEARRSVWGLLPQALEERSLDDALQEEVRRFAAVGQEKATFRVFRCHAGAAC